MSNLLDIYVRDGSTLPEWIGFDKYTDEVVELFTNRSIVLQPGLNVKEVCRELKTKVEIFVQTAFDETFAWLMTQ